MKTATKTFHKALIISALMGYVTPTLADVSISHTTIPNADILLENPPPGQSAKIGMKILDINIEIPTKLSDNAEYDEPTILTHKLDLRHQTFTYDWPAGDTEYKPDEVYAISYGLELAKPINQKWMMIGFGSVGAYTDFEGSTDAHDYLAEGGALAVYQFKNGIDLGIGPVYTHAFGNGEFILAPFFRYKSKGNFLIDVRVPKHAVISYIHEDTFMISAALRNTYNNFHVNPPADPEGTIVFSDVTFGIEAKYRIYEDLLLDMSVAQTIDRTLEIQDNNGDVTANRELDNTTLYKIGLSLAL